MTVKELVKVMGTQFIAVGTEKFISYSGRADKFKSFLENCEVAEIIAPKNENSATLIIVK